MVINVLSDREITHVRAESRPVVRGALARGRGERLSGGWIEAALSFTVRNPIVILVFIGLCPNEAKAMARVRRIGMVVYDPA